MDNNQDGNKAPTAFLVDLVSNRKIPVATPRCRVGRDDLNDIVISGDQSISRFHFIISFDNGEFTVQDAKSRHGTFLNGNQLTVSEPIKDGDVLKVGVSLFWFVVEGAQSETADADSPAGAAKAAAVSEAEKLAESKLAFKAGADLETTQMPTMGSREATQEMAKPDAAMMEKLEQAANAIKMDEKPAPKASLASLLAGAEQPDPEAERKKEELAALAARDKELLESVDDEAPKSDTATSTELEAAPGPEAKAEDAEPPKELTKAEAKKAARESRQNMRAMQAQAEAEAEAKAEAEKVAAREAAEKEEAEKAEAEKAAAEKAEAEKAEAEKAEAEKAEAEKAEAEKAEAEKAEAEKAEAEKAEAEKAEAEKAEAEKAEAQKAEAEKAEAEKAEAEALNEDGIPRVRPTNKPSDTVTLEALTPPDQPAPVQASGDEAAGETQQNKSESEEMAAQDKDPEIIEAQSETEEKSESEESSPEKQDDETFASEEAKAEPADKAEEVESQDRSEAPQSRSDETTENYAGGSGSNGSSAYKNGNSGSLLTESQDVDVAKYIKAGASTVPDWCKRYFSDEIAKLNGELDDLNDQVRKAQQKIRDVETRVAMTRGIRNTLLTTTGDELVEACGKVLSLLGWKTTISAEDKHELSLEVEDKHVCIARVIWTTTKAERSHLGQLSISQTRYWMEKGIEPKGIIIVSKISDSAPTNVGDSPEEIELNDYAAKRNVCLMSTMQLLSLYREIALSDASPDKLRASIVNASGWLEGHHLEPGSADVSGEDESSGQSANKLSSLLSA